MTDQAEKTLMEHLKESTREMHDSAESSQFQGHLTHGRLPLDSYVDYLEQLYLVHGTIEREIQKHAPGSSFDGVVTQEQLQVPFLKRDLEHFKRSPEKIKAVPSTENLLKEIARLSDSCPPALLGMHYVLLGSKHGAKFIAKSCKEKYQLDDSGGVVYFDPYGPNFMPLWKSFKESMNKIEINESEMNTMCDAAGKMFIAVGKIGAELLPFAKI